MARVDPFDDAVHRWVILHYRYDPERAERRNVAVAAFDDAAEFEAALDEHARQLRADIAAGRREARERVSGHVREPGHRADSALRRLLSDASSHGADPRRVLAGRPVPGGYAMFGWDADGSTWSLGAGDRGTPAP